MCRGTLFLAMLTFRVTLINHQNAEIRILEFFDQVDRQAISCRRLVCVSLVVIDIVTLFKETFLNLRSVGFML